MLMYCDIYANDCNVSQINVYITIQTICSILAISLHKLLNSKHLFRKLFLLSYKVYSYKNDSMLHRKIVLWKQRMEMKDLLLFCIFIIIKGNVIFGHDGSGGQSAIADPTLKTGMAYVTGRLKSISVKGDRENFQYRAAYYRCLERHIRNKRKSKT